MWAFTMSFLLYPDGLACVDSWPFPMFGLENMLDKKEHKEADVGYIGEDPKLIKVPKGMQYKQNDNEHMEAALARHCHETGNHLSQN